MRQAEVEGWLLVEDNGVLVCGQSTTIIILTFCLNPTRRPQSRKGRLAADALRQRRVGVKDGYHV
ncbi:MAG: hypothetical protein WAV28_12525 [Sedimentisphaerales bacterium]